MVVFAKYRQANDLIRATVTAGSGVYQCTVLVFEEVLTSTG